MKFFILIFVLIMSSSIFAAYPGSSKGGFWHSSTISKIQLGWDKRIYIYLNEKHKCSGGSDLLFYHPEADGKEMILSALLSYESSRRVVSFRIDSCEKTDGDVTYGLFDKMEGHPLSKPIFSSDRMKAWIKGFFSFD